jgi:N-acetylglucosamine malate deacetylase 2
MTFMRGLLVVVAHPDDETVGAGATIARYARDGITRVGIVSATSGQAASFGLEIAGSRVALGALRERELRAAAEILGAHDVHVLDYMDKELAAADVVRIRRDLVAILRAARPDVVVTFDPNGTNGHADHVAISRFTMDAVSAAADPRWFPDLGAAFLVRRVLWTPPRSVWSMIRDEPGDVITGLAGRPGVDYLIPSGGYANVKHEAMLAHVSQRPVVDKHILGHGDTERVLSAEVFRHALGPRPSSTPGTDIFGDW